MKMNKTFVISLTMMAIMLLIVGPASAAYLDSDGDGTADAVEKAMISIGSLPPNAQFDPNIPVPLNDNDVDGNGILDNDADGVSDFVEMHLPTYYFPPTPIGATPIDIADIDGDWTGDGLEIIRGSNPFVFEIYIFHDTDGDWLSHEKELMFGTDPLNPDTDGDGLMDGEEVNTHGTEPLDPDTDAGGISDGDEVNIHDTNPLDPNDDPISSIPEFPTIALPVISLIGLMFLFQRRTGK